MPAAGKRSYATVTEVMRTSALSSPVYDLPRDYSNEANSERESIEKGQLGDACLVSSISANMDYSKRYFTFILRSESIRVGLCTKTPHISLVCKETARGQLAVVCGVRVVLSGQKGFMGRLRKIIPCICRFLLYISRDRLSRIDHFTSFALTTQYLSNRRFGGRGAGAHQFRVWSESRSGAG